MAFTYLCLVSSTLPPCELSVTERLYKTENEVKKDCPLEEISEGAVLYSLVYRFSMIILPSPPSLCKGTENQVIPRQQEVRSLSTGS